MSVVAEHDCGCKDIKDEQIGVVTTPCDYHNRRKEDMLRIELTDAQAEIADWAMGSPLVEEWFNESYDAPEGCDFSGMERPRMEDNTLVITNNAEVIDDFLYRVNEQYLEMAQQAAEVDQAEYHGIRRASNNLAEKIEEAR